MDKDDTNKMKKITLNIDEIKWEEFKKIAKIQNSDGNKIMRQLIDSHLDSYKYLLDK